MIGVIIKGLGGLYTVSDGKNFSEVKAKGVFRKDGIIPMIGDKVRAENGVISEIFPRKNSLVRPPVSNIDKLFIVSSLKNPEPDFLYIDKLTVIAVKFGITPILVFSKSDLSDGSDVDVLNVYSKTPYKVIFTSSVNNIGAKELLLEIKGFTSAFAGFSGVGKSSLLNMISSFSGVEIISAVGDVSRKLGRGKHTTRHVELFSVNGGFIADTPGFGNLELSYFGIKNRETLSDFFPEFSDYVFDCRFSDCSHIGTKGCAVKEAVERGKISRSRYESYCRLYNDMGEYKFWEEK